MQDVFSFLPGTIQQQLEKLPVEILRQIEEIRLRVNRPIEITYQRKAHYIHYIFRLGDAEQLLNKLSKHSLYTLDEELKRGYITIEGGHRVGLAGRVILDSGVVKAIREVSSFNIRIAKEQIGVADQWIPFLFDKDWKHTMIIGPPQTGKTTLLRDIARIVSTGSKNFNIAPQKVGIIDERSEIAGCLNGVPQLTFGIRVDVLDSCPKAEGMMMMIRSMSPDVLVVDEIGRMEDTEAILEAVHAGIKLVMTTHGDSLEDLYNRPTLKPIMDQKIFQRYIELSKYKVAGTVAGIRDADGKRLQEKASVLQ